MPNPVVHVAHSGPHTRWCYGLPPYRAPGRANPTPHAGEPCAANAVFFVECPCDEGGCAWC